MSKAVFTLPDSVKPVADKTKKIYKTYLNRLAAFEIDSMEKILMYPEDINQIVEMLVSFEEDEEKRKAEARIYYSAVFFVLYNHSSMKDPENPLRLGFQRYRPASTTKGEKWQSVEQYKKTHEK